MPPKKQNKGRSSGGSSSQATPLERHSRGSEDVTTDSGFYSLRHRSSTVSMEQETTKETERKEELHDSLKETFEEVEEIIRSTKGRKKTLKYTGSFEKVDRIEPEDGTDFVWMQVQTKDLPHLKKWHLTCGNCFTFKSKKGNLREHINPKREGRKPCRAVLATWDVLQLQHLRVSYRPLEAEALIQYYPCIVSESAIPENCLKEFEQLKESGTDPLQQECYQGDEFLQQSAEQVKEMNEEKPFKGFTFNEEDPLSNTLLERDLLYLANVQKMGDDDITYRMASKMKRQYSELLKIKQQSGEAQELSTGTPWERSVTILTGKTANPSYPHHCVKCNKRFNNIENLQRHQSKYGKGDSGCLDKGFMYVAFPIKAILGERVLNLTEEQGGGKNESKQFLVDFKPYYQPLFDLLSTHHMGNFMEKVIDEDWDITKPFPCIKPTREMIVNRLDMDGSPVIVYPLVEEGDEEPQVIEEPLFVRTYPLYNTEESQDNEVESDGVGTYESIGGDNGRAMKEWWNGGDEDEDSEDGSLNIGNEQFEPESAGTYESIGLDNDTIMLERRNEEDGNEDIGRNTCNEIPYDHRQRIKKFILQSYRNECPETSVAQCVEAIRHLIKNVDDEEIGCILLEAVASKDPEKTLTFYKETENENNVQVRQLIEDALDRFEKRDYENSGRPVGTIMDEVRKKESTSSIVSMNVTKQFFDNLNRFQWLIDGMKGPLASLNVSVEKSSLTLLNVSVELLNENNVVTPLQPYPGTIMVYAHIKGNTIEWMQLVERDLLDEKVMTALELHHLDKRLTRSALSEQCVYHRNWFFNLAGTERIFYQDAGDLVVVPAGELFQRVSSGDALVLRLDVVFNPDLFNRGNVDAMKKCDCESTLRRALGSSVGLEEHQALLNDDDHKQEKFDTIKIVGGKAHFYEKKTGNKRLFDQDYSNGGERAEIILSPSSTRHSTPSRSSEASQYFSARNSPASPTSALTELSPSIAKSAVNLIRPREE